MIFFVLKSHGSLHLGNRVNKRAQGVAGQRVIVAAGIYVFELAGFVVAPLGIGALKEEAFNFVGGVQRVTVFLVQAVGIPLEDAANVSRIGFAILVDDVAEDEHFARTEDVGRSPIECAPIDAQPQIALALRCETTD